MLTDTPRTLSRLDLLYLATREFNTGLDLYAVLNRVLTATVASLGASDTSLSIFDEAGQLEHFIPITGFQERTLAPAKIKAIHEEGLVAWVQENRQAILIEDVSADARWYYDRNKPDLVNQGSAIGVPVQTPEQFIGALVITSTQTNYFDDSDLAMLTIIADQAAFAINNARLIEAEQHRRRLADTLVSVARTVNSSLDLDEVLNLILKNLARVIEYDSSTIMLCDEEQTLSVKAARGFESMEAVMKVQISNIDQNTPNYQAILQKKPVVIADVEQEPGWKTTETSKPVRSWIGAPLIARDKVIGMLTVDSYEPHKYTPDNAQEVAAFADQAATAVANAQSVISLQNAEATYTALFEHSTDAIFITDYQGNIINVNHKACQLLLRSKAEIIGSDIGNISTPLKDLLCKQNDELRTGKEVSIEIDVFDTTQQIVSLELHGQQVRYADLDCVQWTGRDISARKEAEKMRQDLVNMLVHDLRGPVGNLINVIEMLPMLIDATNESPAFQNILEMARRSGQEVRDLIDSMLDVGLLEQGEIPLQHNPMLLDDLIQAVHEQVEPRASAKETELILEPLPEVPVMWIDGSMIRRVLINLIDNAIKYTPNEGLVTVTTTYTEADNVVHFAVTDNGPGISQADQTHIFNKFSRVAQTSKTASGVGLGLAFCKLAVEAHGGNIAVESEGVVGRGSTFHFSIPIGDQLEMEDF